MKVSPELVGHNVCVQLARPLYMIDYAGHLKLGDKSWFMGEPVMTNTANGKGPILLELLYGVEVVAVTDDSVTVAQITESRSIVHHTFPSALILNISEVVKFDVEELPTATRVQRAAPAAGKILV
jgi:hypothetical protein